MERRRCWFSPMRPVTPFMMMPTEWIVFSLMEVLRFGLFGTLRAGSGGERRYIDAGLGKRAVKFLAPVGDIAGGSVAVEHAQRGIADIGQLVEDLVRDVDGLPGVERHPVFAEAHFAGGFDDEVDFFIEGTGKMSLGEERMTLHTGQAVYIPHRVFHQLTNIGDTPLRMLYCYGPAGDVAHWRQELDGTLPRAGVDVPALPAGAHPQCTEKPRA